MDEHCDRSEIGFYFCDTKNYLNPQGTGATGTLADPINLNSSDAGSTFLGQGFFYLNVSQFGTQGIGGPDGWHNSPGEPYRDIGYRKVDEISKTDWMWDGSSFTTEGADSGSWNYQELNDNGKLDVYVAQRTVPKDDGTTATLWMPVPWFPGCTPGMNTDAGANCSEPHEPYLNLIYTQKARTSNGPLGSHFIQGFVRSRAADLSPE